MKKLYLFLLVFFAVLSLYGSDLNITVIHTNDIHGQSHPFDYRGLKNYGGAARRATLINDIRKEVKNRVFLFDIGDISGRGEYENYYGQPEIKLMNYLKYDAMTLGNAEYKLDRFEKDQGPRAIDIIHKRVKEAKFPCLCANVYNNKTGKREFLPYVIFEEKGVRIACVGMTTLKCRTYPQTVNLTFTDPAQEWKKVLEELKGKYDFLIFMSHLGDLADVALAKLYTEIDMVIQGDFHTFLDKPMEIDRGDHKCIICQTGELGICVGRCDLTIDEKTHKIKNYDYRLIPVTNKYKDDEEVNRILSNYRIMDNFSTVIASSQPLPPSLGEKK